LHEPLGYNLLDKSCIEHIIIAYHTHPLLATCSDSYQQKLCWITGHLTLTKIITSLLLVGIEMAFHEVHHYLLFSLSLVILQLPSSLHNSG